MMRTFTRVVLIVLSILFIGQSGSTSNVSGGSISSGKMSGNFATCEMVWDIDAWDTKAWGT